MTWFDLIVSVVVHLILAFILMYCSDNAKMWKDGTIYVENPSVYNLKKLEDKHKVNEYVERVIKPSHHYFILKKSIESHNDADGLSCVILQAFSFLLIVRNVSKKFPNQTLPKILYLIIVIAICLAVCCLGCYLVWMLYKKCFAIDSFRYSREDLEKQFVYDGDGFDISEEDAFNNYIIMCHYEYLRSIEDTVIFRKCIMKVITWVSTIIYILFFWKEPN